MDATNADITKRGALADEPDHETAEEVAEAGPRLRRLGPLAALLPALVLVGVPVRVGATVFAGARAVLVVPSLINRWYVLDLGSGRVVASVPVGGEPEGVLAVCSGAAVPCPG